MTRKIIKDAMAAIRKGGGSDIVVREATRHTCLDFTNPEGDRFSIILHKGDTVRSYVGAVMRSRLRRAGLSL